MCVKNLQRDQESVDVFEQTYVIVITYGPQQEKTFFLRCANNKGADQPEQMHNLISIFVICLLESVICK